MESKEQYLFHSAPLPHLERKYLFNRSFENLQSIVEAAITTQEKKTLVNFCWFLAIYMIIYEVANLFNNFPRFIYVFYFEHFHLIDC